MKNSIFNSIAKRIETMVLTLAPQPKVTYAPIYVRNNTIRKGH